MEVVLNVSKLCQVVSKYNDVCFGRGRIVPGHIVCVRVYVYVSVCVCVYVHVRAFSGLGQGEPISTERRIIHNAIERRRKRLLEQHTMTTYITVNPFRK